ncbi:hypothetical protein SLA_3087 [Streptomyces laurentii]|uniref:ABM domain-containing protein n=1 Tax=Streptomyces laurentii TaxID=39478 RepID=A0A160P0S5_STRLU|nr:hypothetical protein SLA_3087 [Streptomyces laurentii]
MAIRSQDTPLTVINRFRVKGDGDRFVRKFRAHSQYLRARPEFDFLVTVQLVDQPEVVVNLAHWRTVRGFLRTVHEDTFQEHVRQLGPLVETEADQALSVARVLKENALVGTANILLTRARPHGDPHDFERRFAELDDRHGRLGGFGGSDLLRSTLYPDTYLGLQWWYDADECDRALLDRRRRALAERMAEEADLVVDRGRHLAYERDLS